MIQVLRDPAEEIQGDIFSGITYRMLTGGRVMSETTFIVDTVGGESAEAREAEMLWRNRQLTAFQRISEVLLSDALLLTLFDTIARVVCEMTGFSLVEKKQSDFDR